MDADAALAAGHVWVAGARVTNPRALVRAEAPLVVEQPRELRGTLKLRAALTAFEPAVAGRVVVDLGASTGGFTVALLEAGAARVYAVDAGYGQLLGSLRQDPRVVCMERTNLGTLVLPEPVALATVDLAYLALAKAAPQIARAAPGADVVALVKPMYELGRASAPTDEASLAEALARACAGFEAAGYTIAGTMRSPIEGGRGAVEMFLHATV